MRILASLRRLFAASGAGGSSAPDGRGEGCTGPAVCDEPAVPMTSNTSVSQTAFIPSFQPFKPEKILRSKWAEEKQQEEWEEFGAVLTRDNYPFWYGIDLETLRYKELFRSSAEVEWARTFDRLRLPWEYEPLKFDMGPTHVSYTPDFKVTGLSISHSTRPLYIEVKRFPDDVDLTKYVRFTEWYDCDLLVLAHKKGGILRPKKQRYFLVLRCTRCNTHDCFSCIELPHEDYHPSYWPSLCQHCQGPFERMVVPNYFLIQAGRVDTRRVVLPELLRKP